MMNLRVDDYQQWLALQMSERELQEHVLACAKALGFMAYHTHTSTFSAAGFPDLVLIGPGATRLVIAELKREQTRRIRKDREPTPAQLLWLEAFRGLGRVIADLQINAGGDWRYVQEVVETYLWRPSDWFSGRIGAVLKGQRT